MTTLQELQARKRRAHKVEVGATSTAGAVGSVFGAAKLRDEYRRQSPEHAARFTRATTGAGLKAIKHGADPVKVSRLVSTVESKHPPFKALAAATAAAGVAGAARKYQGVQSIRARRRESERQGTSPLTKGSTMTVSAFGIDHASPLSKAAPDRWKKPSQQNSRGQNARTGAEIGGGMYGAIGAGLGTATGVKRARGGLRDLKQLGAGLSRTGTARVITHAASKPAGKAGAAGLAIGAAYGGLVGASAPARKRRKAAVSKSATKRKGLAAVQVGAGTGAVGAGVLAHTAARNAGHAHQEASAYRRMGMARGDSTMAENLRVASTDVKSAIHAQSARRAGAAALGLGALSVAAGHKRKTMAKSVSAFGIDHAS